MSLTGPVEGPPSKFGIAISDIGAGMWAACAIGMALFHRERSGQGQFIDTSMIGGVVALLTFQAGRYFSTGKAPGLGGNKHPTIAPYETFKTTDGWLNVACGNEGHWRRFCEALGLNDLLQDEQFATNSDRLQNRAALNERLDPHIAALTTADAVDALEQAEVPAGPVFDLAPGIRRPAGRAPRLTPAARSPDRRQGIGDRLPLAILRDRRPRFAWRRRCSASTPTPRWPSWATARRRSRPARERRGLAAQPDDASGRLGPAGSHLPGDETMPLANPTPLSETGFKALFERCSNWGRWGADDQRGTLN